MFICDICVLQIQVLMMVMITKSDIVTADHKISVAIHFYDFSEYRLSVYSFLPGMLYSAVAHQYCILNEI